MGQYIALPPPPFRSSGPIRSAYRPRSVTPHPGRNLQVQRLQRAHDARCDGAIKPGCVGNEKAEWPTNAPPAIAGRLFGMPVQETTFISRPPTLCCACVQLSQVRATVLPLCSTQPGPGNGRRVIPKLLAIRPHVAKCSPREPKRVCAAHTCAYLSSLSHAWVPFSANGPVVALCAAKPTPCRIEVLCVLPQVLFALQGQLVVGQPHRS